MSDKFYKSIPADLQKVVTDAARVACNEERKANRTFAASGSKTLAEKGVTVYSPTPAELAQFRAAAQPPVIEFLKTKIDPKLIEGIQTAVKDADKK
jgi:TRAP-type C4-dicarboxylate transport system substrate-binding protein